MIRTTLPKENNVECSNTVFRDKILKKSTRKMFRININDRNKIESTIQAENLVFILRQKKTKAEKKLLSRIIAIESRWVLKKS